VFKKNKTKNSLQKEDNTVVIFVTVYHLLLTEKELQHNCKYTHTHTQNEAEFQSLQVCHSTTVDTCQKTLTGKQKITNSKQ
jgi:hypothetical protein